MHACLYCTWHFTASSLLCLCLHSSKRLSSLWFPSGKRQDKEKAQREKKRTSCKREFTEEQCCLAFSWGSVQQTLCHALHLRRRGTVAVNNPLRASRSAFLSYAGSEQPRDRWTVCGASPSTRHSYGPRLPIAAGKVSSVYETINYTYLI